MRKYVVAVAAILIIAIILVFVVIPRTHLPRQKIYQSSYTATNIQFPYLVDSGTVDFFTGSAFASYSLATHTTKTLSPQLSLPPISDIRWSSSGVLFKASNSTPADDLYPAATSFELNSSQEYWWRYSFATQQITYVNGGSLGAQVTDVAWINGDPSHYDYVTGDRVIRSDGQTLFTDTSGVARLDYASPTAVLYETTSSSPVLKERNLAQGTTSTIVAGSIKDIAVAHTGNYVVYVDHYDTASNSDTPGDLELLNLKTHKTSRVMSGYEGVTSLNSDSDILISSHTNSTPSQLLHYSPADARLTILNNNSLDQNKAAASLWVIDSANYIVDSASNLLTVFRNRPATQPIYPNYDYLIQSDLYQNGFEIHYRTDTGLEVYNIYISQNPYLQYQQAALQYIDSQKIDPNLINIKWYSNDGVARPTYVNTSVPPDYFVGR